MAVWIVSLAWVVGAVLGALLFGFPGLVSGILLAGLACTWIAARNRIP